MNADSSIVTKKQQGVFLADLRKYVKKIGERYVENYREMRKQERLNANARQTKGEVSAAAQAKADALIKLHEKLDTGVNQCARTLLPFAPAQRILSFPRRLCEALGELPPPLPQEEETEKRLSSIQLILPQVDTGADGGGVYESEDERLFYESLIDLRNLVPMLVPERPVERPGATATDGSSSTGNVEDDQGFDSDKPLANSLRLEEAKSTASSASAPASSACALSSWSPVNRRCSPFLFCPNIARSASASKTFSESFLMRSPATSSISLPSTFATSTTAPANIVLFAYAFCSALCSRRDS